MDDAHGVITATETTPGDVEENAKMLGLLRQHESNAGKRPDSAVADSQYGTSENYRDLTALGVATHMKPYAGKGRSKLYGIEKFNYDAATDTYACPAGKKLYPRSPDKIRMGVEYVVRKGACVDCPLRPECTNAKSGRTVLRRWGQELIDEGLAASETDLARYGRDRRKWLMEGSFAQSANLHGFKRSRWRRLFRQRIQDHIISAIENIKIAITRDGNPSTDGVMAAGIGLSAIFRSAMRFMAPAASGSMFTESMKDLFFDHIGTYPESSSRLKLHPI